MNETKIKCATAISILLIFFTVGMGAAIGASNVQSIANNNSVGRLERENEPSAAISNTDYRKMLRKEIRAAVKQQVYAGINKTVSSATLGALQLLEQQVISSVLSEVVNEVTDPAVRHRSTGSCHKRSSVTPIAEHN